MTTAQSAISALGLSRKYGSTRAVDGLDLEVSPGEVFGLLGPNGAGKTTTIEILEGYRRRDAGRVRVLGHDPGERPSQASRAWRARIGIVLQASADLGEFTVAEVVRHFATFYPQPRPPHHVIDEVGLAAKRRTRTRQLSGGERRRLDVALGIIGNPELLFLDEPTTGFDPEARQAFWGLIKGLSHHGTTIVLTTHYLDEAEHLADRVGVIIGGRLVATDQPTRLGGRDRAPARVQWRDGAVTRSVITTTPTRVVHQLRTRFEGEVPDLSISRPSLEDAYLRLIKEHR